MTQQAVPAFLTYASYIADGALDEGYDYDTIFASLAIATASFMMDFATRDGDKVDDDVLQQAVDLFGSRLNSSLAHAKQQATQQLSH